MFKQQAHDANFNKPRQSLLHTCSCEIIIIGHVPLSYVCETSFVAFVNIHHNIYVYRTKTIHERYCVISCLFTQGYFGLVTEQTDSWTLHVSLMGAVFRATECDLANVLDKKLHYSIIESVTQVWTNVRTPKLRVLLGGVCVKDSRNSHRKAVCIVNRMPIIIY